MKQEISLDQLREAFLQAPESTATRIVAVALSGVLLAIVLILVRRRTLREEYTPIWVGVAVTITLISLRLDLLRELTRMIGAWTPSSTIFFLGEVFLVVICLNYAVRLSRHGTRIQELAQENAILRRRLEAVEERAPAAPARER